MAKFLVAGSTFPLQFTKLITRHQMFYWGFPGFSNSKESACNSGDQGSIPGLKRSSGEGNCNPLQYSLPKKSHGQRSLAGYSPQGCKESDTTHTHRYSIVTTAEKPNSKTKPLRKHVIFTLQSQFC